MERSPQAQAFLNAASARYISENGLSAVSQNWTRTEREEYTNFLAGVIVGNPELFSSQERNAAVEIEANDHSATADYNLLEIAGDFYGEFIEQGQSINPFSEQNRSKTAVYLVLGVGVVLISYVIAKSVTPLNVAGLIPKK